MKLILENQKIRNGGNKMDNNREQWTSKFGFILASAGAAIGLGAIWKFPYVAGMSGGGAFFLIFVIFTLAIGLPMLISEYILGRGTAKEAVSAYKKLAPDSFWVWIGRIGVLGCFLLLTFYSVVGGWVLIYSLMSVPGQIISEGTEYGALFDSITGSASITLIGLALFTIVNIIVISLGVKNGIERANKYMMPLLFLFFIILVVRSLTLEGAMEGIAFFLKPDFTSITAESLLYALGQSFFSLAVGFSCMVTYSSYLDRKVNLTSSAGAVVTMNLFVSLLAGLAVFPVVFAFGLEPAEGPGLLFVVLPTAFAQLPFGGFFLAIFLILFLFAIFTSSFSLYEIIVAAFTVNRRYSRTMVSSVLGIILFFVSIPAALSSGALASVEIFGASIFDATDYLVSNIMLPLGSLLIAIFIIHKVDKSFVQEQYTIGGTARLYATWRLLMTWVVPISIVLVYLSTLGIIG